MSSEEQQPQQQKTATTTTTTSSSQQEAASTPATSAIKNNTKRVSIKGTPNRVKISAPYAYVEVIELMLLLFWHVLACSVRIKAFVINVRYKSKHLEAPCRLVLRLLYHHLWICFLFEVLPIAQYIFNRINNTIPWSIPSIVLLRKLMKNFLFVLSKIAIQF